MSKIFYQHEAFTDAALGVIASAEQICQRYAAQGYSLTLRQLYYQFIAADAFPESRRNAAGTKNHQQNYKWLGDLVSKARVAGRIDWNHIEDRTRSVGGGDGGWDSPAQLVESNADIYHISRRDGQQQYIEVWVEKEALADVIRRPCRRWRVPYFACKGSPSTSEMHSAALRLRAQERDGLDCTVIYLGDHDPTGMDIPRDVQDRLALFRSGAEVKRIALNMDQILELDPPPSPAKLTDSRAQKYIEEYGDDSWELDAIDPAALDRLVEDELAAATDMGPWEERAAREQRERIELMALSRYWAEARQFLDDSGYIDELAEENPVLDDHDDDGDDDS